MPTEHSEEAATPNVNAADHTPIAQAPHGIESPHAEATHPESAQAEGSHEGGHSGPPELENFWNLLAKMPALNKEGSVTRAIIKPFDPYVPDPIQASVHKTWQSVFFGVLTSILIIVFIRRAIRRRAMIPSRGQSIVEMLIEGLYNFFLGVLGEKHGHRYVPFLLALFLFIMFSNLMGLIPLMKASTGTFQLNIALGISVFLYVQYTGLRYMGPKNYFLHFMGNPSSPGLWLMGLFLFPLHVIGELVRPLSLSLRLFGNVLGEDVLLGVFATMGITIATLFLKPLGWEHPWFGIPLHLPFMFLATLTSIIQALIFSLLSCVYLSLALPHEEGGH